MICNVANVCNLDISSNALNNFKKPKRLVFFVILNCCVLYFISIYCSKCYLNGQTHTFQNRDCYLYSKYTWTLKNLNYTQIQNLLIKHSTVPAIFTEYIIVVQYIVISNTQYVVQLDFKIENGYFRRNVILDEIR